METFSFFHFLTMLGGLALFLFGMSQMGDGLERASSGKLESLLEKMTTSRIKWLGLMKGVVLGAAVTAIIQSSSATTVTVVGFVNSGVMKLGQAIPIIMGSNIGTTITSWILSLVGIESSNFFIQLLKPTSFSPILAIIGAAMNMFAKSEKKKMVGGIFLGFAVMMYGMDMMGDAMEPLSGDPKFQSILTMFENPILGVLTGAVLTGVIQSSAASVGILQMLALSGHISYGMAIPIIMGQNIGTCVTALISCIGANKNAQRAAMVHLYFNIIGTVMFLILYAIGRSIFDLPIFAEDINAAGIAVVHSVFNIASTLMLLPFPKMLEKLACMTIRDRNTAKDEETVLLDDRLLTASAFAIARCKELTAEMAELSNKTLLGAIDLIDNFSPEDAQRIIAGENKVDVYEDKLGSFLVKLSANNLSNEESREASKILHGIGDLERLSDHAVNVMEVAQELYDKKITFSEDAQAELNVLTLAVREILDLAIRSFETGDVPLAKWVEPLEEVIDDMIRELKLRHIERLQAGRCTVEMGFIFNDLLANYERVADHCSNLAICVIEIAQGEYNAHEYAMKMEKESDFTALYRATKRKYILPKAASAQN
ncbi:MAG: Na/Pi cotransporter family protein [Clostridia bacterium]|nr:Na/Pi cotransporter family protein [Clostridia bacterium]